MDELFSLKGLFLAVVTAGAADMFVFGTLGLEAFMGHTDPWGVSL